MNQFTRFVDLASQRLGGRVLEANDDFFAPKDNLLKPSKPIFIQGKYTERGKWMDGWRRGGVGRLATTGASSDWACRE